MKHTLSQRRAHTDYKHRKKFSIALIREMQIKTTTTTISQVLEWLKFE